MNPELTEWTGPLGLPRFDLIADQDFAPVAEADVLVPRGHAVAGGHQRIIAASVLKI